MATNANRIFVNGLARVYLGPVGTVAPTDPSGSYNAALVEVGYFTDDSLNFSTDPNFETVTSHQENYPTRRLETPGEANLAVDLQEWSDVNFQAVYGGGTVAETSTGSGIWKFTPPEPGARDEKMCVVKCIDGAKTYALIIPRCQQVEGVDQDLGRGDAAILPLRLSVLGASGAAPFYWLAKDTNFKTA